jgi:hypothetical protein
MTNNKDSKKSGGHKVMANLAKVLKDINKAWKDAEEQELGGFVKIADGDYKATMDAPRVELSKQTERLQIAWPFKISEGKSSGKTLIKFDGLDNEVSMGYAKGMFNLLGIPIPSKAEEIPDALESWFKEYEKDEQLIALTVKTKDEFTNIYVNGFVDAGDTDDNTGDSKDKKITKSDTKKSEKSGKSSGPTKKDIRALDNRKDLKTFINDHDLKIDVDDYEAINELQDAIIEELGI